jgi:subtilisin family serine protease
MIIYQNSYAQNNYYYYKGQKVFLTLDKNYINIITNNVFEKQSISNINLKEFYLQADNETSITQKFAKAEFLSEPNQLEFLQKVNSLKGNENIKNVCFYYKRNNGTSFGTSNIFYVKLKSVNDFNKLQQVAIQKNLQIINQIPNMPTWYILALNKTTIGDVIAVTNQIYETGLFEDVDPAFMFKLDTRQQNNQISNPSNIYDTCANDTYFNTQWGLKSNANISHDIKACNAWPISQGDGIKVAVVDFGIGKLNPDLADNISNLSLNTIYGGSTSATIDYNHGSAVASIIAAVKDNNLQIAGIAPKSKIMDVKFEIMMNL